MAYTTIAWGLIRGPVCLYLSSSEIARKCHHALGRSLGPGALDRYLYTYVLQLAKFWGGTQGHTIVSQLNIVYAGLAAGRDSGR